MKIAAFGEKNRPLRVRGLTSSSTTVSLNIMRTFESGIALHPCSTTRADIVYVSSPQVYISSISHAIFDISTLGRGKEVNSTPILK